MKSNTDNAKETQPLMGDKVGVDYTFGLYPWWKNLHQAVGINFLVMLFFVEHLLKGFVFSFVFQAQSYVYGSYHVPAPSMQIYGGVTSLPWAMKPIIGLVSDLFPIRGYNKAPYMIIASFFGAVAFFYVGAAPTSSLPVLGFVACLFAQNCQLSANDLLAEAKYAEKIRSQPAVGPSLLTYVWFGMAFGTLMANVLSGVIIKNFNPKLLYLIAGFPAAAAILPVMLGYMEEEKTTEEKQAKARKFLYEQKEACFLCVSMFLSIVTLTAVALISTDPLINCIAAIVVFIFTLASFSLVLSPTIAKFNAFSLIQGALSLYTLSAGFYFNTDSPKQYPEGPHFSPYFFNTVMGTIGSVLSLVGIASYEKYLSKASYRSVLVVTNIVVSLLSLLDCCFYARLNVRWGIPDHVFVLGTAVLEDVIRSWQWMPQVIILSYLCPKGMEATMYALLAGCMNLGRTVASTCGAYLLTYLGVKPDGSPHESAQFENLWKASLVSAMLPLIAVLALFKLIPDMKPGDEIIEEYCDATGGSLWKKWTESPTKTIAAPEATA